MNDILLMSASSMMIECGSLFDFEAAASAYFEFDMMLSRKASREWRVMDAELGKKSSTFENIIGLFHVVN